MGSSQLAKNQNGKTRSRVRSYEEWGDNQHIDLGVERLEHAVHDVMVSLVDEYGAAESSLLEIGSGRGEFLSDIEELRPDLTLSVADSFQSVLDRAAEAATISNSYLLDSNSFDLELKSGGTKFDLVIASHVLEHFLDPVAGVRGMVAATKPGGHVIIAVPNVGSPVLMYNGARQRHCANPGHVVGWDRSHWINFLENILELNVVKYASDSVTVFPRNLSQRFSRLRDLEALLAGGRLAWWADSHFAVIRC